MTLSPAIDALIKKYSLLRGIPEQYLRTQIAKESSNNPKASGDGGRSRGLMQIYDTTAINELGVAKADLDKLFDPEFSIDKGTQYLNKVKTQIGDTSGMSQTDLWQSVFMGYNSGPAYQKKANALIRARGEFPTFEKLLLEMQKPGFGRTPIYKITIPYAQSIVMGKPYAIAGLTSGGTAPLSVASMTASIVPTSATGISGTLLTLVIVGGLIGMLVMKKGGGAQKSSPTPSSII